MRNFLIIPILFIFLVSCSNSEDFDIPKISKLEKLEEHSNQFIKGIYSYDNGIHVAIGFGIANSIMVEGEGGNIIIDTTDDVSQAKEVLSEFQKINQNPIKAIIYTHNHGDHVFGASEFYYAQEENTNTYFKPVNIFKGSNNEKEDTNTYKEEGKNNNSSVPPRSGSRSTSVKKTNPVKSTSRSSSTNKKSGGR